MIKVGILFCTFALAGSVALAQKPRPLNIYVGPQIREGFVDVDAGTLNSIVDLESEIYNFREFKLVDKTDDADLVLFVLGRGRVSEELLAIQESGGSSGIAIGGIVSVLPDSKPTVRTLLKVGTYEKPLTGQSGTWIGAAAEVVKDLRVWTKQNRDRLPK